MENLSQSELINTIINLSNKVEQLKMQNDHLREIRLQLASLAVNNNYGSGVSVSGIEKTTNNSFIKHSGYVSEENGDTQSIINDDLFSSVTTVTTAAGGGEKVGSRRHWGSIGHDMKLRLKHHDYKWGNEVFGGWLQSVFYVELLTNLTHFCKCYLFIPKILYIPSYLTRTIAHYIFSIPLFNSISLMEHCACINNIMTEIFPICCKQCQLIKDSERQYGRINSDRFSYKSGIKLLHWYTEETFFTTFEDSSAIKSLPEQSISCILFRCLETTFLRSNLGYMLSYSFNTDLSVTPNSCFLRISVKRQTTTPKVGTMEYQDRSVKSYSLTIAKTGQFKPPIKLVINSYSSVPKKISISKEKLQKSFLRRTNSVVDMRMKSGDKTLTNVCGDYSDNESLKSRSITSASTNMMFTTSRKLWHEKCKTAYVFLFNITISELILYTEFTISMLSNDVFELNFNSMRNLAQEYIERRKNEIIQSQLGPDPKGIPEKKKEDKSTKSDDYINLNSLNALESTFSKYSFSNKYFNKYFQNKNIYDMKNIMKSNISLNLNQQTGPPSPGLSKFQVKEMIKMNPDILKGTLNQSHNISKISDSMSDSSSTLVQSSQYQLFKYQNAINDEMSENKKTSSCCGDSLTFTDPDLDMSISFSQSDQSMMDNDTSLISVGRSQKSRKVHTQKKSHRSLVQEDFSKTKSHDHQSKLAKRKSSIFSDIESDKRYTKSDHDYKEQKNKIKLSFLKHISQSNKTNSNTRVNLLRKKAASYILNSKLSYNNWRKENTFNATTQIKNFLDKEVQDMISSKNYQCDKCSISFKLGTELRQHLRSHNIGKKSCAI